VSIVPNRVRWSIAIAFAALASLGLWLARWPGDERAAAPDKPPAQASVRAAAPPAAPARPLLAQPTASPQVSAMTAKSREVVGPGPDDPHEPGVLPHPTDEARERIHAENLLIQALNDAMSFRKVKEMREMLVEYRKLDPSDVHAHQAGYKVIADCIEFPGEASLAAAREFYDTQRHSPLRRFVRRICFENAGEQEAQTVSARSARWPGHALS
jgi:hypothetical protein